MTSPSGQIMRQFGQMENEIMLSLLENVFSIYCVQGCWVIVIREDLIYVALGYWMSEQSGWRSFYLKIWRDSLRVSDFVVVVWWTTGLWKLQKQLNQTTSEKEVETHSKVGPVPAVSGGIMFMCPLKRSSTQVDRFQTLIFTVMHLTSTLFSAQASHPEHLYSSPSWWNDTTDLPILAF